MTCDGREHTGARAHARSWLPLLAALAASGGCTGSIVGDGTPPAERADPPTAPVGPTAGPPGKPPPMRPAEPGRDCNPAQHAFAPARLWQLTDAQYVNVVRDVFGITLSGEDAKIVSAGTAERYTNYSEGIAIDTQAAPNYQTSASKVADLSQPRMAVLPGSPTPN